ncbi:hypothetical protein [Hydrogenophaga sp. RWCD_12]|uniref:hypothetical protein n=1 Tax=Hydrogenophaga sp. RWCD_12 TaxID=3391190 RepID=UPI0039849612
MALLRWVFSLLLATPAFAASSLGDAVEEARQISETVDKLFYTRQFQAINDLDKELRTVKERQRLSDGRWSVTFLYDQLDSASFNNKNYEEWGVKSQLVVNWDMQTPFNSAPKIASSYIKLGYAWAIRGGGYASQIDPERLRFFNRMVGEARSLLESPTFEKEKHPLWFLQMLTIANLQSWDPQSFGALFNAAVTAYPGYEFLYFKAADYYLPQWHGSKAQIRKFVDDAVTRTKATEGMTMYTRIYWYMLSELGDKTFDAGNAEWLPMKQGFERLMQDYPNSQWNLNAFAYYACMAKDWNTFRKLQPGIGDAPAMALWKQPSRFYTCIELAKNPALLEVPANGSIR